MKVSERTWIVQQASVDISSAVTAAVSKHPTLTHAELTGILGGILLQWNKYAIRDERGVDPETGSVSKDDTSVEAKTP